MYINVVVYRDLIVWLGFYDLKKKNLLIIVIYM